MKSVLILASLLSLAAANPLSLKPTGTLGPSPCFCKPPICPLELIAECRCKNAAAKACYENYLSQGISCPSPTPLVCGVIARADQIAPTAKPIPTIPPNAIQCGGLRGLPCPLGMKCVDDPRDSCDPAKGGADCIGICTGTPSGPACGGFLGLACPEGMKCIDDPRDDCDPRHGGADCIGICIGGGTGKIPCAGKTGATCPKGYVCVDDPSDSCDPAKGGKDCGGICVGGIVS